MREVSHFTMRTLRYLVVGMLTVGLVVTSIGWYWSTHGGSDQRFESCHFEGETLVLSYRYGVNQSVSPSIDTRSGDVVVSLRVRAGHGSVIDIGLMGDARFAVYGGPSTVRYRDGKTLDCPSR